MINNIGMFFTYLNIFLAIMFIIKSIVVGNNLAIMISIFAFMGWVSSLIKCYINKLDEKIINMFKEKGKE